MSDKIHVNAEICKVDEDLGLVFGWAIICKKDGEAYFDLQDDHITEKAMVEASLDFMLNSRMAKDMHTKGDEGVLPGSIVFAFPMTTDVAKAFNMEVPCTGLMIGMKPDSEEVLQKFKTGVYTGFSIGGSRIEDEEVD